MELTPEERAYLESPSFADTCRAQFDRVDAGRRGVLEKAEIAKLIRVIGVLEERPTSETPSRAEIENRIVAFATAKPGVYTFPELLTFAKEAFGAKMMASRGVSAASGGIGVVPASSPASTAGPGGEGGGQSELSASASPDKKNKGSALYPCPSHVDPELWSNLEDSAKAVLLSPSFKEMCNTRFDLIDADNSGTLDKSELPQVLRIIAAMNRSSLGAQVSEEDVLEVLSEFDSNGDGVVNREEFFIFSQLVFITSMVDRGNTADDELADQVAFNDAEKSIQQRENSALTSVFESPSFKVVCETQFTLADVDGNGQLDADEILSLLQLIQASDPKLKDAVVPSAAEVARLMTHYDTDNNGTLNMDEFVQFAKASFTAKTNAAAAAEVVNRAGAVNKKDGAGTAANNSMLLNGSASYAAWSESEEAVRVEAGRKAAQNSKEIAQLESLLRVEKAFSARLQEECNVRLAEVDRTEKARRTVDGEARALRADNAHLTTKLQAQLELNAHQAHRMEKLSEGMKELTAAAAVREAELNETIVSMQGRIVDVERERDHATAQVDLLNQQAEKWKGKATEFKDERDAVRTEGVKNMRKTQAEESRAKLALSKSLEEARRTTFQLEADLTTMTAKYNREVQRSEAYAKDIASLESRVNSLREQIAQEQSNTKAALRESRALRVNCEVTVNEYIAQIEDLTGELATAVSQRQIFEAQANSLSADIDSFLDAQVALKTEGSSLRVQLDDANVEIERLKSTIAYYEDVKSSLEATLLEARKAHAAALVDKSRLGMEAELGANASERLELEVSELRARSARVNESLNQSLEVEMTAHQEVEHTANDLKLTVSILQFERGARVEEVHDLTRARDEMTRALRETIELKSGLERNLQALTDELERTARVLDEKAREITSLKEELSSQGVTLDATRGRLAIEESKNAKLTARLDEEEQENSRLMEALRAAEGECSRLIQEKNKLQSAKLEAEASARAAKASQEAAAKAKAAAEASVIELSLEKDAYLSREAVAKEDKRNTDAKIDDMNRAADEAARTIADRDTTIASLREELSLQTANHDKLVETLRAEHIAKADEMLTLEEKHKNELADAAAAREALNRDLEAKQAKMDGHLKYTESLLAGKDKEIDRLRQAHLDEQVKSESLSAELAKLKENVARDKVAAATRFTEDMNEAVKPLSDQVSRLTKEKTSLTTLLADARALCDHLGRQNASLEKERNAAQAEVKRLTAAAS